jgi:hypothetical protein
VAGSEFFAAAGKLKWHTRRRLAEDAYLRARQANMSVSRPQPDSPAPKRRWSPWTRALLSALLSSIGFGSEKLYAVLLTPVAFVGAFTVLPFVERSMAPGSSLEAAAFAVFLVLGHAGIALLMRRIRRWPSGRIRLGYTGPVWLTLIVVAYLLGAGSALLLLAA